MGGAGLRVRVLGRCEATLDGRPVDLGGPRQRAVLALLVTAHGAVVPADRISEDLWRGEPPPRAAGALQAYVSHLRKALEPDRPPRAPATVIVSASPGYALRLADEQVDAWHLESLVRQALPLAGSDPARARELLAQALRLWGGQPYGGYADEDWAAPEAARLEELHSVAVEHAAEAALATGSPAEALSDLEPHAAAHPLREGAWRLLALALYRGGRQAEALAALRELRRHLADELGVDPSPAVQQLEADILDHAPSLAGPAAGTPPSPEPVPPQPTVPAAAVAAAAGDPGSSPYDGVFLGRGAELHRLVAAAERAATGALQVALVSGDPGAGKSALADELGRRLAGHAVAWGRCPEVEGAPALYPWSQLVRALPAPAAEQVELAPLLDVTPSAPVGDPATQRFRLHRAVARALRTAASARPLLVVLDDLHRADDETLSLLVDVLPELADTPVLLVGTFRVGEMTDPLAAALAALARYEPVRLELGGLAPEAASELVRQVAAADLALDVVETIVARTDGNPFYVREAARLAGSGASGSAAAVGATVPEGVRDVIGLRLARLPASAHTLLRMASVQGREVDVDVLLDVSDLDEDDALDGLDSALVAGIVEEPEPGRLRFSHALVQETLYDEISLLRRARWHARTGESLERLRPGDHAGLAHHFRSAGPAYRRQVVRYAALAAEQADRRHAYAAAVELWHAAIAAASEPPGLPDLPAADLAALHIGLIRTHGHSGNAFQANRARREAIEVVRPLGDPLLLARVITAWDTPAFWTTHPYGEHDWPLIADVTAALDRLDRLGGDSAHDELRCRLLVVLALETEALDDEVVRDAPARAVTLARRLADPALLCPALDALTRHAHSRLAPGLHDAIGAEMVELAREHQLAAFEGLGLMLLEQRAGSRGDLAAAESLAGEMARLGEVYGLPALAMVARQVPALVAYARDDLDEAERLYREFGAALASVGALSVDIYQVDVDFLVAYARGSTAHLVDRLQLLAGQCPPLQGHLLHALLSAGRTEEASALWPGRQPPARDIMWAMYAGIDADNALALGSTDDIEAVYGALSLISGRLAGGESGFFTLGPADTYLARLALRLGRREDAERHAEAGLRLARSIGNLRWAAQAQEVLTSLGAELAVD